MQKNLPPFQSGTHEKSRPTPLKPFGFIAALLMWLFLGTGAPLGNHAALAAEDNTALTAKDTAALETMDFSLAGRPGLMRMGTWNSKPALTVVPILEGEAGAPAAMKNLLLLRPEKSGWKTLGRWPAPEGLRFVETVRLPNGKNGWLAWLGSHWIVGQPAGDDLRWQPVCQCPPGNNPFLAPKQEGVYAHDLDGDGVDEVLLPRAAALEAYGMGTADAALSTGVRLWRAAWNPKGKPVNFQKPFNPANAPHHPAYNLQSLHGTMGSGGNSALVLPRKNTMFIVPLADTTNPNTPILPYTAELPGVDAEGEKDKSYILAQQDMNGDGVLDVVHVFMKNRGKVFKQENTLRWFKGRISGDKLSFGSAEKTLLSGSGSMAILVRPRTDNTPPHLLMTALAEVTFGTVMKALTTKKVTLDLRLTPWQKGELADDPLVQREVTYESLRDDGRRAMFIAADLDGDGQRDYVLNLAPDRLTVYLSRQGRPLLADPALVGQGITLPSKDNQVLAADLDGDGREELLLTYQKKHYPKLANVLRLVRLVRLKN